MMFEFEDLNNQNDSADNNPVTPHNQKETDTSSSINTENQEEETPNMDDPKETGRSQWQIPPDHQVKASFFPQASFSSHQNKPVLPVTPSSSSYTQPYYSGHQDGSDGKTASPVQEDLMSLVHKEIRKQKSVLIKIAALVCALSLLLGCTGGFAISKLTDSTVPENTSAIYFNSSGSTSSSSAKSSSVNATATAVGVRSLADVVEKIQDCVVAINITGTATDYFNRQYPTEGSGSGVIISSDGIIITNNHVISGGNTITVFLNNNKSYTATVLGADEETDLAVLKVEATGLTAATIGDSDKLRVGDTSIAIGNPLGELQGTVTAGIISALSRSITIDGKTLELMQTDTAINPGNSGGGLFNAAGELVGIVTAKTSQTGIEGLGFVIPINNAMPIAKELMTKGYVSGRPTIGLTTVDITDRRTAIMNGVSYLGVYVYDTLPGGPAAAAGLQTADYIVSVDGRKISSSDELNAIVKSKNIGDVITMLIRRNNQELTVQIIVAEEK